MLTYALRRLLWAAPTLAVTSLVLFFVASVGALGPEGEGAVSAGPDFGDLPAFVNFHPRDVRSRARRDVSRMAGGDEAAAAGAAEDLCRLGGAALPVVLPFLETLPPRERGRVALDLAPVAERMGVASGGALREPDSAVVFWMHFWESRALDFTRASVARAVERLVEHGSDSREADVGAVDTFALPEVIRAMAAAPDPAILTRLTRLALHSTGRGAVVDAGASEDEVRRVVADWQEWWFVHESQFVEIRGPARAVSFATETRYGKWVERVLRGELGVSVVDGEPITAKLRARAPVTALLCGLALLGSFAVAVPVGAFGAWRRGRPFDVASTAALFVLYAVPTFAVAELLRAAAGRSSESVRIVVAAAALAVGAFASLSRWQRAAMLEVVRQDFVRTAHAKGLAGWRVAAVHAMRIAVQPMVALAGLHAPMLLGGALVVESIFRLPGVGYETLRAVEARDTPWLVAVLLVASAVATLALVATDVVSATIDPRVREALVDRRAGGTA